MKEEWKEIKDFDNYLISNYGNVKNKKTNKVFKKTLNHYGYIIYCLRKNNKGYVKKGHRLVAEAFIPNPNNYPIVMHIDNNKANPNIENLQWGTVSQNTKAAFDDGLQINDRSWNDSQSVHVCVFDMNHNLLDKYGSIGEASRALKVTKTTILNQCNHGVKTKPRCGYYFRYLSEYETNGFVL